MPQLARWWETGATVGLGTVVEITGSSPREPGASMAVGPHGEAVGSVSGGCVEASVYELSREAAATGTPALVRYGISGDDPYTPGLTCGGSLEVFASPVSAETFPDLDAVVCDVRAGRPVAVATIVEHRNPSVVGRRLVVRPRQIDTTVRPELSSAKLSLQRPGRTGESLTADARSLLDAGRSECLSYGPDGQRCGEGTRVFVQSFAPPPRMLVFGATDYAAAVARMGTFLGYRVTVCDARPLFATPDPKFDFPVLSLSLRLPRLAYVGAMGSRQTHQDRLERLRAAGLTSSDLSRLSSPVGLDLGAKTPEETAVSIAAEIIAARSGGSGARLRDLDQPIHHRSSQDIAPVSVG